MLGDAKLFDVKELEATKNKLLLDEERDWRIKSRATWVAKGDNNKKNPQFCIPS